MQCVNCELLHRFLSLLRECFPRSCVMMAGCDANPRLSGTRCAQNQKPGRLVQVAACHLILWHADMLARVVDPHGTC